MERDKIYPHVNVANREAVKQWGIHVPYALVEVEVNSGLGSPGDDGFFVATHMRRLDGSKDYPLDVVQVVQDLRQRYRDYVQGEQKAIDAAMAEAQKTALGNVKLTGPGETQEQMYATWLTEEQQLQVRFYTKISEGAVGYEPCPGTPSIAPTPNRPCSGPGAVFGVKFCAGYDVTKDGKVVVIWKRPVEEFHLMQGGPPW